MEIISNNIKPRNDNFTAWDYYQKRVPTLEGKNKKLVTVGTDKNGKKELHSFNTDVEQWARENPERAKFIAAHLNQNTHPVPSVSGYNNTIPNKPKFVNGVINQILNGAKGTVSNSKGYLSLGNGGKGSKKTIAEIIKEEQEQIAKGYNEVLNNPLKGDRIGKDDILAELKPSELKSYLINRGAAIKDPKTGDIVVQGNDLKKATGTGGNFGFSKIIFKHGITPEEAKQIPHIIRDYNPYDTTLGKEKYRIKLNDKQNLEIVFGNNNGKQKLITVYKENNILPNVQYSKKKSLNAAANFGGIATTTNQAVAATGNGSQGLSNTIPNKPKFVNGK